MPPFRRAAAVAALTIAIGWPWFATHTPDSPYYVQLVRYFRGEVERRDLTAPYAYRPLVPFVAAQLPIADPSIAIAVLNVTCAVLAYLIFDVYLRRLLRSPTDVNVGMLLAVVSFPTFAYSSRVLTDAAGFLALTAASMVLLRGRRVAFSAATSVGILARDSLVTMIAAFLLYEWRRTTRASDERRWRTMLLVLPPLLVFVAVRWHFAGIADVTGVPSPHQVWSNLAHPLRSVSLLLTVGPPALLWFAGARRRRSSDVKGPSAAMQLPVAILSVSIAFGVYSIVAFVMGGRYVWGTFPGLIPLAVDAGKDTALCRRYLAPAANALFGGERTRFAGARAWRRQRWQRGQ